jgi:hypothetical protein
MSGSETARFHATGKAVAQGKAPRPIEADQARRRRRQGELERQITDDHMGDGHPRAAVATRLGEASLDAHAVDHRVARPARPAGPGGAGDGARVDPEASGLSARDGPAVAGGRAP